MQLPKPLLILVVVLIVLAVAGTCASFVGPDGNQDDAQGGLTDFLDDVIPDPEPVVLQPADALIPPDDPPTTCLNGNRLLIPNTETCIVEIRPTDDLRRELELRVDQGNVLFKVSQGGATPEPTQVVPFNDDGQTVDAVSIVVSRDESATATLRCQGAFGCSVRVNPPDA